MREPGLRLGWMWRRLANEDLWMTPVRRCEAMLRCFQVQEPSLFRGVCICGGFECFVLIDCRWFSDESRSGRGSSRWAVN